MPVKSHTEQCVKTQLHTHRERESTAPQNSANHMLLPDRYKTINGYLNTWRWIIGDKCSTRSPWLQIHDFIPGIFQSPPPISHLQTYFVPLHSAYRR